MLFEEKRELRGSVLAQLDIIVGLINDVESAVATLLGDTSYSLSSEDFEDIITKVEDTRD